MRKTLNVQSRSLIGLLQLIIIMGLLLFLPAGTFSFWQAWAYLASFFIPVLIITIYLWRNDLDLLQRRLDIGAAAEKEVSQKIIQAFASIIFLGIILLPALDHRFHWSSVPIALVITGDLCVVLGLLIVFLVFKENSFASAVIETDKDQTVVSTGPYRMIRHPMYSGALLMLFFTPLALGSFWGLIFMVPVTIVIVLRLLDEERFLCRNLPGYQEYCSKVHYRLLPFIF